MKKLSATQKIVTWLVGFNSPLLGLVLYWALEENNDKRTQEILKILKSGARLGLIIYITICVGAALFELAMTLVDSGIIS